MNVAETVRRARSPRASIQEQHAAFSLLVERFERMAFATALKISDDPEAARDACQEAFLLAWRTLSRLEEPAAFGGWLKRLVHTQCSRARRRSRDLETPPLPVDHQRALERRDVRRTIRRALDGLPDAEREAITLFYFLGEPLRTIARELHVSAGNAGKLIYNARLDLRRRLPRSVAAEFLARRPTTAFARRVRAGLFDDVVGEYRFPARPDHAVLICREGDRLVSYAGGQRNVLASRVRGALVATEFDGEARFRRDDRGRVKELIYYEFGRRLGVARRVGWDASP